MDKSPSSPRPFSAPRYALTLLAVLLAWTGLYVSIQPLATWLTFDLLSLTPGGAPGLALEFFLYDSAKILLLLVLMVYCIGWLRAGLHVERVRDYLSGKGRGIGYLLGATFGAITPFCSCSSIPLFLGFTMARIPLGITMAFLITSGACWAGSSPWSMWSSAWRPVCWAAGCWICSAPNAGCSPSCAACWGSPARRRGMNATPVWGWKSGTVSPGTR